jgi:hypothetical protein|tara:strand:- start:30 stop:212 length:183 start_codon:yes stop_codon:yes gene_type:complete
MRTFDLDMLIDTGPVFDYTPFGAAFNALEDYYLEEGPEVLALDDALTAMGRGYILAAVEY